MEDFEKISAIRRFVNVEERGIAEAAEFDWFDGIAAHILVTDDDNGAPIAAARMYPDGELTRIDRITVMPSDAAALYAEFVLRLALYKAQTLGGADIAVAAECGLGALCAEFGLLPCGEADARGAVEYRCARDGVKWFSHCAGD